MTRIGIRSLATLIAGAAASALLTVVPVAGIAPAGASPTAPAAPGECVRRDANGVCIVRNDPDENGDTGDDGGGGGGASDPWVCLWTGPLDSAIGRAVWPEAPAEASYWVWNDCGSGGGNGQYDPWERVGFLAGIWMTDMAVNMAPLDPPSPAEVAADLWSEVQVALMAPTLVVSPAAGRAAIVDQPAFVAVRPWAGTVSDRACDDVVGVVCVDLVAVPHLTFDPGDGSEVIACEPGGTPFDPEGDPEAQADAPGACAHRYGARTGTDGRPPAWPGTVTVTWEVSWSSTNPDASGTFDDFSLSADLDRSVDEVQGVIVDREDGAG